MWEDLRARKFYESLGKAGLTLAQPHPWIDLIAAIQIVILNMYDSIPTCATTTFPVTCKTTANID